MTSPDEAALSGARFIELGPTSTVTISDLYNSQAGVVTPGQSYTLLPPTTSNEVGVRAINHPGVLLKWKCSNFWQAAIVFRADIYLVCRGMG